MRRLFEYVLFVSFGLTFLFVIISLSFIIFSIQSTEEIDDNIDVQIVSYRYKYLKVDSISKKAKKGVISVPDPISFLADSDSISFEPSAGIHYLFSNFGADEYYCSGSCYCSEEGERRSTSSITKSHRGLLYLVSAVSSAIAFREAGEYFSKECQMGLEGECERSEIYSEVDRCESVNELSDTSPLDDDDEGYLDKDTDDDDPDTTEYMCSGRCVIDESSYYGEVRAVWDLSEKDFNEVLDAFTDYSGKFDLLDNKEDFLQALRVCHSTETTLVTQFCNSLKLKNSKVVVEKLGSFDIQEAEAIDTFMALHLHKFCKSKSFFTQEEIKDRFTEFNSRFYERFKVKIETFWDEYHKYIFQKIGDGVSVCRASRHLQMIIYDDNDEISDVADAGMVVCQRQFTDEEWEKKIPYESENLRHWKEGYQIKPEKISGDEAIKRTMGLVTLGIYRSMKNDIDDGDE